MAKYFLGSVGRAEAFKKEASGEMKLLFSSKTLTDSGINISTSKDDIRAGEGAPIQFSFYHDPNVEITLTDVLWKREYLEAQLGAEFTSEDPQDYITREIRVTTAGKISLGTPSPVLPMNIPCSDANKYVVWYTKAGADEWQSYSSATAPTEVPGVTGAAVDDKYCVRYLAEESKARVAEILSTIIPAELFLIITAPIYAGDACSASRGKAAGHITFEVPRFQLDGSQDFTMNMSSNQTMSLSGIALASTSESCDNSAGQLLRIIEVLENEHWYDNVTNIVADDESLLANGDVVIYAVTKDGSVFKCNPDELGYAQSNTHGEGPYTPFTNGKYGAAATIWVNIVKADGRGVLTPNDQEVTIS